MFQFAVFSFYNEFFQLLSYKHLLIKVSGSNFLFNSSFSGGVLEPEGTVEIKFKLKDQLRTMERLDPVVRDLKAQLATAAAGSAEQSALKKKLALREESLKLIYYQVKILVV
jgi:hypothetical protein